MKNKGFLIYVLSLITAVIAIVVLTVIMWDEVTLKPISYLIAVAFIIVVSQIVAFILVRKKVLPMIKSMNELDIATIKMRQEFSANISHELKTPLTAISGYAELIEEGMEDEEKKKEFAGKIKKESGRLLRLINDIIRISELDEAESLLEFVDVDLFKVTNECMDELAGTAQTNSIKLIMDRLPVGSLVIKGDESSMHELVYNLIDNAIRYNKPEGEVHVGIKKKSQKIIFYVEDTGIGIPKQYQERIFERFFRVDKSRSRKTGGTGLGLSIVKHIAIMHDAKIYVESEEDKGSTISVAFKEQIHN